MLGKSHSVIYIFFPLMILLHSFPAYTSACSCAGPAGVEEEFERSKAVFSGKVFSIKDNKRGINGYSYKSVLFEVTQTWKGVEQSQVIVATGQGDGDCGIPFKEGQDYLVYVSEWGMYAKHTLEANMCGRSKEMKHKGGGLCPSISAYFSSPFL